MTTRSRNRLVLLFVAVAVLGYFLSLSAQQHDEAYTFAAGRVGATDDCEFTIGPTAMLLLYPEGVPCIRAREFVGRSGRLVFVPDPEP